MDNYILPTLQINSRYSLFRPTDFLPLVRYQLDILPQIRPTKYVSGLREELLFPESIDDLVPAKGDMETIRWDCKRTAQGHWSTIQFGHDMFTHGGTTVFLRSTKYEQGLIEFMKGTCGVTEVSFGFLDALTPQYIDIAYDNGFAQNASLWVTTYVLHRYLPDMPWAALFGPEYVALFGKERLLATPAFKVEELGDDLVFVQLTEKMNDIRDKFDMVMTKREEAKQHLGYDCFYQKELLYHWDKNINNKSKPPYRAPSFTLIDNENAVRKKAELWAFYKANREEDRKRGGMSI